MKTRIILYADAGKLVTDGQTYGKQIFLAEGTDPEAFYEVTQAEYEEILAQEEEHA